MSDKELLKIVSEFTKGILGKRSSKSMCFAVCCPLQGFLSLIQIYCKLQEGYIEIGATEIYAHYWLKLPSGKIIDPTADQFNELCLIKNPRIYIGDKPEHYIEIKEPVQNF